MKLHLLIGTLCCSLLAHAQQAKVVAVQALYDTTAVAELYNRVPLGLQLQYSDNSVQRTTGFLQGSYRWNRVAIRTSNGVVQNGYLTFNRQQLAKTGYRVDFTVTLPDNQVFETAIRLPYVTGIRFNHYADSIKRDIRYYLNVEGKFSSGHIFPLDTATIRFETSAGKIIGQDLLLEKNDTVKTVTVQAWYKYNPAMYLRSTIPVKQAPDNDSLIIQDSRELFNKRKKKH
ncbi:hypothetical protein [Chitinophaga nivalis]|uniref:DUF3108 domain-containing protein n=1 Tax=Chitinophaga nivalis TaxID=2991709 RepID=A0ABT3IF62_9BACT|nr:hypothetical protein [Chitinophaga nivalis]MCW3467706.1 hypothetical protein [Chitinophaga nivalis]MCW3482602.1 hypothetical protein [Chitinophaga nivalis]